MLIVLLIPLVPAITGLQQTLHEQTESFNY
jgi:hypothetical protein